MSRIIKLLIAFVIAVALTAGFLYVKLKKDEKIAIQNAAVKTISEKEKTEREKMRESITAPESGSVEISQEMLDSVTAPKDSKSDITQEMIDSVTAPNN